MNKANTNGSRYLMWVIEPEMIDEPDLYPYHDELSREHVAGEYTDTDSLIAACQQLIDRFLEAVKQERPWLDASSLYALYEKYGRKPFPSSSDPGCTFSHQKYAKERCFQLCSLSGQQT